jgi:hypothetical protein
MKIIEALKLSKDLLKKAEDLRQKVAQYHADLDFEVPTYGTAEQQKDQVAKWCQAHSDILKEIAELRMRIQKTNCLTNVTIELGGVRVSKTITEWIARRKDLALLEKAMWDGMTDKNLPVSGQFKKSTGEAFNGTIRRYYDPATRDSKRETFRAEPSTIDSSLEVINAITDLL